MEKFNKNWDSIKEMFAKQIEQPIVQVDRKIFSSKTFPLNLSMENFSVNIKQSFKGGLIEGLKIFLLNLLQKVNEVVHFG